MLPSQMISKCPFCGEYFLYDSMGNRYSYPYAPVAEVEIAEHEDCGMFITSPTQMYDPIWNINPRYNTNEFVRDFSKDLLSDIRRRAYQLYKGNMDESDVTDKIIEELKEEYPTLVNRRHDVETLVEIELGYLPPIAFTLPLTDDVKRDLKYIGTKWW